jgi:hypothetical protein
VAMDFPSSVTDTKKDITKGTPKSQLTFTPEVLTCYTLYDHWDY